MDDKPLRMVSRAETDQISRKLLVWLNQYENKPANIAFEYLPSDQPGMALSTIKGPTKQRNTFAGRIRGSINSKSSIVCNHPVTTTG